MGFFKSPFVIHHRVVAKEIKDFILSLDATDMERDLSQLIQIELRQYIFERNCLRLGLAHQILAFYANKKPGSDVDAAHAFFLRIMMEYNENLRSMNALEAYEAMNAAQNRYYISETPPTLPIAGTFIGRLTNKRLDSREFDKLPQFLELVDHYIQSTVNITKIKIANLK